MKYKFRLPIGDWSGDGHSVCDWYLIESSHSVEDVREMFFDACSQAGYDFIEEFCSEYLEGTITVAQSEKLPFSIDDYWDFWNGEDSVEEYGFSSNGFARLFLDWIKYYNPTFNYKIINDDMLPFYGVDDKGRHIGFIGYGLFE